MNFTNISVTNFDGAIRGMRNPMNSWDKSDSGWVAGQFVIGENDLKLCKNLIKAGTSDSKYLRQINVCIDITAPIYWWKEMDQYKIGTTTNSTSTMHKLASTPITLDCFEYTPGTWNKAFTSYITTLEALRKMYVETKDKSYWKALIQMLPESWKQTRTWTANYAVLRAIYQQRRNHRLSEWHDFCDMIETLPYAAELITGKGDNIE